VRSIFNYIDTCGALSFGGGGTTDSYDSSQYSGSGTPAFQSSGGNVGTNGNLTESRSKTTINGSLSTPRAGVGSCSSSTITALSVNGNASVKFTGGGDWYGSVIAQYVTDLGGAAIHYDRHLQS